MGTIYSFARKRDVSYKGVKSGQADIRDSIFYFNSFSFVFVRAGKRNSVGVSWISLRSLSSGSLTLHRKLYVSQVAHLSMKSSNS